MDILYLLLGGLKIVGVVILIGILILLLMIIAVFIVPIKYKLYINKTDQLVINTHITWLYSIISFKYFYHSGASGDTALVILGKKVLPKKNRKVKSVNVKHINRNKEKKTKVEDYGPGPLEESGYVEERDGGLKKKSREKMSITRIKKIFKKIHGFQYKNELLVKTIGLIIKIMKPIMPSTLSVQAEIGMKDPALTGKLIGGLWALYPTHSAFAHIKGNYEEECLYGTIKASGKFDLGYFLYEIIKYIRLKSVKEFLKLIKKDRKGNENGRKVSK